MHKVSNKWERHLLYDNNRESQKKNNACLAAGSKLTLDKI